ncbi:MAG: hypothetical protein HYS12_12690 [Planctomycetes bacterium]|nr:hypothetical protein [Planctomycetota bacterium]
MWRNRTIPLRKLLLCAWAGLLTFTGAGRADDLSDLKVRLETQEKQIQELRKLLEETRKATQGDDLVTTDPQTSAGATTAPKKDDKKPDESAVNAIVEKYLRDHPGAGMPSGVQTGFEDGNGFVIRSNRNPSYTNWSDDGKIPFELQIHGRLQNDYYGYKVTDTRNHFTNFDTGRNTVGDESALLVKRARLILSGSLFDPNLRFNLTYDGNTRGIGGIDARQNSFANPIGNVEGGQGIANVDHAVRFFEGWIAYDFHPCWSEKGCGCDCPEGTVPYQPTYGLIVGKLKPMFGIEEFAGGSAGRTGGLGGSGREQFVEFAMATWFFDGEDDNLLMAAGIQIYELEDRLFVNALMTNGNETQTPYLQMDRLPGFNLGFWYDFGGTWDEQRKRWQLYGAGLSDLDYSCNPVLRVGASSNLVPMDRRSIYTQAELDRVRTIPPTPNGGGTLTGVLNGGGVSPAVAAVAGTSAFAVDAFDSYNFEGFASFKWRGFSLTSDSWLRTVNNFRGEKDLTTGRERPILYSVNNVGSNALTNVALFNHGALVDYGTLVQGGYFVIPKKLELVARYSVVRGESGNIRGDGAFTTLSAAQRTALGIPTAAAGGPATVRLYPNGFSRDQEAQEFAVGFNYYFKGHNMKFQTDLSFYNGGNPAGGGQSAAGFIPGVDGYLVRSQFQLGW